MSEAKPSEVLRQADTGVVGRGADALASQLVAEGVEVIFGLPGDQLMHALQSLAATDIDFVVTRHEQATTFMADGYARAGGRPGVALVVPGPGVYNAGSGLATAYACSSPVLLLAGQVPSDGIGKDLGLLHDLHDQLDLVRPVTKHAERVTQPAEIAPAVRRAFSAMQTGRPRPVHVEIPPDTLAADGVISPVEPADAEPQGADPQTIARAAALLAGANAPLVIAGGGAVLGDASVPLCEVVEALQALVLHTREGKGAIDERHPLFIGTAWNNRRVLPAIASADVILAVGTRFAGIPLHAGQQLVQIDVDGDQIGRHRSADLALVGDAQRTLGALRVELETAGRGRPSRAGEAAEIRAGIDDEIRRIGPQGTIVDALRAGLPDDGLLVCDTTTVAYACHMLFPVYEPRSYFSTSYMGTLGFGYPAALGVKYARPDRPVVTVTGDGGFLFAATEMATATQHGIHTVTVVFDDGAYGNSNRDQRERYGNKEYGTLLRNPDWVTLARAFGIDGVVVDDVADLPSVMGEAIASEGSTVIAVPMERLPNIF
jgi:acetolactate synthase I/II/III large subunit